MAIHKFAKSIDEEVEIELFGDGSTSRDYTYIDDIVEGISRILDVNYKYDIVNLGGSTAVSLRQLVSSLEQALGKKAKIRYVPQSRGDVHTTFADITKAKLKYGYNPKYRIEEGIDKFVKWYQEVKERKHALCVE